MLSDGELLRRYVNDGSEAAFTELVQRHINLVYRSALRRVGRNAHAADDVTQRVFTDLARKGRALRDRPSLGGWLYTSTRFAAAEVVRSEQRRRTHEQEAHLMNELALPSSLSADRVEPFLDELLERLDEREREAVLLHFFEGHTFAELGAILSLSADAARMRVNRAVERLRAGFEHRGIASTGAALAAVLSTQSTIAAPTSFALAVAGRALSEAGATAGGASLAGGWGQAMKSPPLMIMSGVAAVIGLGGAIFFSLRKTESVVRVSPVAAVVREAPPTTVVDAVNGVSPTVTPVAPAQPSTMSGSGRSNEFARLTPEEKNLLAMLWTQREKLLALPHLRVGLKVGGKAPNADGVERLVAKGWAEVTVQNGMLALTPDGVAFCATQRDEINAYVPFANKPHDN